MGNLRFEYGLKSNKDFKQMDAMFGKCKVNNTLNVFKDAKAKAKRLKSLTSRTNSLMCPKINLCCNQHDGNAIKVESKLGKIVNAPITKDKIIICICA
jgi:hypothetical protein